MARVLVTGAAGWLGSALVCALAGRGDSVRALVYPGQTPEREPGCEDVEVVEGDLRDAAARARFCAGGADVLYHCAGVIHPRRVAELYEVNVRATAGLLDAAAAAGVRRAVVVSSNSPCGCNPHPDHLFDEQSPYAPYMNYGRSKMLMEQDALARARPEIVVVRSPWFYGPRQPARQSLFFKLVREGRVPVIGPGENRRSMTYIDNLCDGLMLAAASAAAPGKVYWIADARPYSYGEILATIADVLEESFGLPVNRSRVRLPALTGPLAQAGDRLVQALGLYSQKLHVLGELDKDIACSIDRARRELGYAPRVELREGMRRSVEWCLKRGLPI